MASPANTKLFLQFALGFLFGVFLTYVTIGYHTEQSNWNFNSDLDDPHHLRRNHEEFTRHRVPLLGYACISGFPRGATPGVPPGTEGAFVEIVRQFYPRGGRDRLAFDHLMDYTRGPTQGICLVSG